jgi:hypothetical protein
MKILLFRPAHVRPAGSGMRLCSCSGRYMYRPAGACMHVPGRRRMRRRLPGLGLDEDRLAERLAGFARDRLYLFGGALELAVGEHGRALEGQFALELEP